MNDRWTDRLSEYVDGDLSAEERRDVEAHLDDCADCAATVADLRDLVTRARGLRELDAAIGVGSDLWPGIEARIRELPVSSVRPRRESPRRRGWGGFALVPLGSLAATGAAVVAVAAGVLVLDEVRGRGDAGTRSAAPRAVEVVQASTDAAGAASAEIAALKIELRRTRDRLDPETLRTLDESLASLEKAVEEGRRALAADPGNPYIESHLAELKAGQIALLRRAVALAGGNE